MKKAIVVIVCLAFALPALAQAPSQAIRANDFLNSIGANTDDIKGTSTAQQVEYAVEFTGVRWIREEATHNTTGPSSYQDECDIHAATGALVDPIAIVDSEFYGEPPGSAIGDEKTQLDTLASCGALGSWVESQNEPNNEPFTYFGQQCSTTTSFVPCANYERDMYSMVNGTNGHQTDPMLLGRKIAGMSEPGSEPDDAGLQYLIIPSTDSSVLLPAGTQLADYANSHGYAMGNGQTSMIDNQARFASDIYNGKYNAGASSGAWDVYGEYWGTTWSQGYPAATCTSDSGCQNIVPKVQTEDGWNVVTAGGSNSNCPAVGNLMVDKFLDNYQLGYSYSAFYHMVDVSYDQGWCAYSANPASATDTTNALAVATSLHNLTQVLADNSSNFTPITVGYPVTGMPSTGYFMPIQKSNGMMEYVLWGESFHSGTTTTVTVNLPNGPYSVVNVYDTTSTVNPSGPPTPTVYNNVSSVSVGIKDHPIIVEFPINSNTTPPTTPFIGRTQANNNSASSTATISTPNGIQSGDLMVLVGIAYNAAPTAPAGWTSVTSCNDSSGPDYITAWTKSSTGSATYNVSGNYPKAIMRVYRGPTSVDASGCSGTATIPALSATTAANDVYVGFFANGINNATITPPADLGNGTSDLVQWPSWDGDKSIPSSGSTPGAEAASSTGRDMALGLTLNGFAATPTPTPTPTATPTPTPTPTPAVAFVARSQASANSPNATATITTPTGTQSGDMLTLVAASYSAPANIPAGWTPLGTCVNSQHDYISAWARAATGSATYSVTGNWPKAIMRDYHNAHSVDSSACAGSLTIPALPAATTASGDAYVGTYINDTTTITPPGDLGHGTLDNTQWWSWDGDKTIASSGTVPGADSATSSGGNSISFGITLSTSSSGPTPTPTPTPSPTPSATPTPTGSLIGRSQTSANSSNATATITTPSGTQSGDMMVLVAASYSTAATGPNGWQSLGTCVNAHNDFISAWATQATGTATYSIGGDWPKAIMRVYRNVHSVDSSACAGSLTIPALNATSTNNDIYVGTFVNDVSSINPPSDLGNGIADTTQWASWDGDKTIATSGTKPGAETATAASGNGLSFGITLSSNTAPVGVQPFGGIAAPSGMSWKVITDDEFNQDSSINTSLWNAGPDGYPMCHTPGLSSSPSTGCHWAPSAGSTTIQDCVGYGGGPSGSECQNVFSGTDSVTGNPFYTSIVPNVGLEIMSANDPSIPNPTGGSNYFAMTWNGLHSFGKMNFQPGDFMEWYAQFPTDVSGEGDGLHSDLWCSTKNRTILSGGAGDELDVSEKVPSTTNRNLTTYSVFEPNDTPGQGTYGAPAGGNLDVALHHYQVQWFNSGGSGSMQIYVDGQATGSVMQLNDSDWLNGTYCFAGWMQQYPNTFPGSGPGIDGSTSTNNPLIVQYFRAWQAVGATPTPTPTTTPTPSPSPIGTPTPGTNCSSVTPGNGTLTDPNGKTWAVNTAGSVVINGVVDSSTYNVIALYYYNNNLYQENTSGNWYGMSDTSPAGSWMGTSAPPCASPTPTPTPSPTPVLPSFIGRTQANVNSTSATATITTPSGIQSGDMMVIVASSYNAAPTGPAGWSALGTCNDTSSDYIGAWTKTATGSGSFTVGGNYPKAIMRVYRGPTSVDSSACHGTSTIPALSATTAANDAYLGFFINPNLPITPPSDLVDGTSDTTQWASWDGDKIITNSGATPPAETASSTSRSISYGITLTGGGAAPALSPGAGSGTTYYVDSAAGSDSNAGTSSGAAWQHLSKVMSIQSSLTGGQNVLLKGGSTWTEEFDVNAAGSAGNPILFSTYGTGRAVINASGHNYCIDAIGTTAKYLTFNNWECEHAAKQGVTFQTSGGNMPGITVENFYIHDTGPGCSSSSTSCVGTDDNTYANQLDFQDFSQGADGVHFLDNTVKWCGGHNCLEVHFDTGAVQVQGNTVGPGCVHACLDVKGTGNSSNHAVVANNTASCGLSSSLCGQSTASAAYYTENTLNTNGQYTDYNNNSASDSPVGYQACAGACTAGSNCPMHLTFTGNASTVSSSSISLYLKNGGCGSGSTSTASETQTSNNWGSGSITLQGFN